MVSWQEGKEIAKKEMESIVSICREHNVISKVIFENCYLEKDEIKQVALIAKEVKPKIRYPINASTPQVIE